MSSKEQGTTGPEKQAALRAGKQLPVMEMFYSIQGEGRHTGKPAAFLRIGGCDVGCHWCDVKEGWNAALHPLTGIGEILDYVCGFPARAVVITGGEPLHYNLGPLCTALKQQGMAIYLETCGAYPLTGQFDWICLSPKKSMPPRPDMLLMADELKVIVQGGDDLQWAADQAAMVKNACLLYLQPEWSRHDAILPRIVAYVKDNPRWMISLQSHKFMRIP